MAAKKQKPAVAKRVANRKAFVKDKVASKGITAKQARQRFYVQTRLDEMKAAGKTVTPETRKKLQQKFQSGNVSRKGFAAPKKKTGVVKPVVTNKVTKPAGKSRSQVGKSTSQIVRYSDKRSASTQWAPTYSIGQYARMNDRRTDSKSSRKDRNRRTS